MLNREIKQCENCKFFLRHYIRSVAVYLPVFCGHCTNPELTYQYKSKIRLDFCCKYWQSAEDKKAERKQRIEEILQNMSQNLKVISEVLIDDKD